MLLPFHILGIWLRAILAVVLIGLGVSLLTIWNNHREIVVDEVAEVQTTPDDAGQPAERRQVVQTHTVSWQFGFNWQTACLVGGILLLTWSFGGGWVCTPRLWRCGGDNPPDIKGEARKVRQPDGTELYVEKCGLEGAPVMVCVHGWSLDRKEWCYFKKHFAQDHRLITWDLPGLGKSDRPVDLDWSLEKLAASLDRVISLAGDEPVILVGHSIGVMILLTYCKLYPDKVRSRVRGLVLAQSTYTNPVKTTANAWFYLPLQKPLLEPLCHLMIWLSPVMRVLNWLSYLNGSAHRDTERESFSGSETRGQLDFMARYVLMAPPAVVARGLLAMFKYDATDVLPRIAVPTLVFAGDQDRACLPEAAVYMARTIPGAKLITLSPARHSGLFEHHQQFQRAVQNFLNQTEHVKLSAARSR